MAIWICCVSRRIWSRSGPAGRSVDLRLGPGLPFAEEPADRVAEPGQSMAPATPRIAPLGR